MVGSKERRKRPEYSLERVHELARRGEVDFVGPRVMQDVENLGYAHEDVCRCLACLDECHYRGTVRYENHPVWMDEYLISFASPTGHIDNLYIKLKLNRDCVVILLASFHTERWL